MNGWRAPRPAALLALAALTAAAAAPIHRSLLRRRWESSAREAMARRVEALEERKHALVTVLTSSSERVAALPEARAALAGDRAALASLFKSLETLSQALAEHPALAVQAPPATTLAWAGRAGDVAGFRGTAKGGRDVFVVVGSVSTILVATAPILGADGQIHGLATAELPVQVRRNIRNAFLSDFDRVAGSEPGVELHYVDVSEESEGPRPFEPLPEGALAREALLRGPDGSVLAAARVASPGAAEVPRGVAALYRRAVSGLGGLALLLWAAAPRPEPRWRRLRLALGLTAVRGLLLLLGPPFPGEPSPLLAPDAYASTLLNPLLRSPLDLLFTALWLLALATLLVGAVLSRPARPGSALRALAGDVLAIPVIAATFAWVYDTSVNSALDLESIALVPATAAQLAVQVALLAVVGAGALVLTAVMASAAPHPASRRGAIQRLLGWALLAAVAFRFWPREALGLPLVPALVLFLGAALAGGARERWWPRLASAPPGARAGLVLALVAAIGLVLYPSLVHFGEKSTRQQIERDHAPLILRQPQWREYVLAETRRRIDDLQVLEETPPGPRPPLIEELAFAVWSHTDLAAFGFSSAVEIQDPAGRVVSRFALNLPSLASPVEPLPGGEEWLVSRERLALWSASRPVLHARRRLTYHGELHGAIHVYVGDDFWNVPFITARDPYSILYRSAARGGVRGRPVSLVAYDRNRGMVFSSAERPPALEPGLVARLGKSPAGLWTTLPLDGRPHHIYLFSDAQGTYGLGYPRLGAGRFAADLVEAAAGLTLLAVSMLLALVLARTLLGRRTLSLFSLKDAVAQRFSLRLFVAFVAIAFIPMVVLQGVVRGFVAERLRRESEDQALERAAVAKRAVEDFAFFQRRESPGGRPVTDAVLVWVASLIRNDLDVFERGRVLASSKRELYASGLLPPRVSGEVFRALALEAQPALLRSEKIGGFSYLVVSVPVRLDAPEPGILSIPLALRQREVETVLGDLDRTIRLASVLFLVAAAGLAQSMARRISGPIRDLTRATRRIAHGDLDARVQPTTRDELRGLVESFNQMAGDLDRQRRDLERSNRLAAWAEMARQVAHEVKNPLTPIQLSAEHLRRVFRDPGIDFGATLDRCVDTILRQVDTLREIVTEFSAFARPPAKAPEPQQLPQLLADVVRPYSASLPPEVSLSLEIGEGIPPVPADRRLLERAILNLVENALQAVGEKGAITVRLAARDGRVEVEVEDTGPGIDAEVRDRIFEPFFSTKTSGSGLGLALVKKIAEDHGGGVTLRSEPGESTRAVLWLPLTGPTDAGSTRDA